MNKILEIEFIKSGLQTLIQDIGRKGHEAFGVPMGGAMDLQSYQLANWLVGNFLGSPVFEITLLGPKIEFHQNAIISITGANLSPKINDIEVPLYETLNVRKGTILSFGTIKNGCRTYLAINGEWKINQWLGSYSAFPFNNNEATPDSLINKGKIITINTQNKISLKKIPKDLHPILNSSSDVRVMFGPEFERFSKKNIASFFSKKYKITSNSNRMGYQLDNQLLDYQPINELISSGIIPGTIQITHTGQPIILMKDAQTTGGYPRIVNVIKADLDKLGQLKPGDELRFELVNLEEAQMAWKEKINFLEKIMKNY